MNVDVDVSISGNFQRIGTFKTVAAGNRQTGKEQVDVGGTVGGTHFNGLLLAGIVGTGFFTGVGLAAKIFFAGPAERHTNQNGTVAVTPADVGGGFLMGDQTEVAGRVGVAESGDGRGHQHETGNGTFGIIGKSSVFKHLIDAVFDHAEVDVHTGTGFTDSDFGSKSNIQTALISEVADDPFGDNELFGGLFGVDRKEFNFVLFVDFAVQSEVTDFGVTVFDQAARLSDVVHAELTEFAEFGVGSGFVITFLIDSGEALIIGGDDVVFQFAHGLEFHAGALAESLAGFVQGVFRGAGQRFAVFVKEGAEQIQGRQFAERIHVGGAETGDNVEVAVVRFDKGEQTGTVNTFAAGEDLIEIIGIVDDKVQSFETSVTGGVLEVDVADVLGHHQIDNIFLGEIFRHFTDFVHQTAAAVVECFHKKSFLYA